MKVSIVIPVLNEADEILSAIEQAWQAGCDEVVVVDGGSDDGTCALIESANCLVCHSPPGRGIQLNAGAKMTSGDVLLFLHADNRLKAAACHELRTVANRTEGPVFGGFKQSIQNGKRVYRWIEWGNSIRIRWQGLVYGDQAMFVSRSLFDRLGGFPEIEIMEDFQFSREAARLSNPILLSGPVYVSSRRWQKNGPVRQTVTNWYLSLAFRFGATPEWIAKRYRRHDE